MDGKRLQKMFTVYCKAIKINKSTKIKAVKILIAMKLPWAPPTHGKPSFQFSGSRVCTDLVMVYWSVPSATPHRTIRSCPTELWNRPRFVLHLATRQPCKRASSRCFLSHLSNITSLKPTRHKRFADTTDYKLIEQTNFLHRCRVAKKLCSLLSWIIKNTIKFASR